jgi:hypothetical protein
MVTLLQRTLLRMIDPREARDLARVRAFRPGVSGAAGPDCLDDETLAALAEGTVGAARRPAALAHLASCERCRKSVASVARALADPELAAEIRAVDGAALSPGRRWVPVVLGVGAVAALLLLIMPPRLEDPGLPHRAPPITAAPAPHPLGPVGHVARAESLRWTPVEGADRYRVTLFDIDGSVRYEAELTDTSVTLPPSVALIPGRTYAWRVDARLGFDRWASSELVEFSVEGSPQ